MEYVELLLILKRNYVKIVISSLLGLMLSLSYYFLSGESYITEGTLYIYPTNSFSQKQEVASDMNFARNIIGISESPEFRNFILARMGVELSYVPLIGLSVGTKIKEVTPNLISLSFRDGSKEKSEKKFITYRDSLIEFSQKLKKGNSSFDIESLDSDLLTYKLQKNIYLFSVVGLFIGFVVSFIYYYLRKVVKND
jgi:capsular polysaccharide biosynthesis protein